MNPKPLLPRLCLLLPLLAASPAIAGDVVIYRCTDAGGALTLQNSPCPKGSREEKRVMQGVGTLPMSRPAQPAPSTAPPTPPEPAGQAPATAPAAPPAAPPSTPAPAASADAARLPPPWLYQCTTHDRDSYFSEDDQPAPRCVPLRTVGLDGNPQTGAGQACEMVRDTCARVADGALCAAWKQRRDAAEVAWRFAKPENVERNRADFERIPRILGESACGR
ncbi:DUF4124 domain-containing protein [Pseudoxanthomonas mexicana]|uniref:DUF4124 domain-containing protein n=1 Tax=Pseudoxanthomonas mexicana TaxID=128785 RepID=UPI00398B207C